jgi:hypothetical protein
MALMALRKAIDRRVARFRANDPLLGIAWEIVGKAAVRRAPPVLVHRACREPQFGRDLLVGQASRDQRDICCSRVESAAGERARGLG